jgi:hypothetical protein
MMKRSLLVSALSAVLSLAAVGCLPQSDGIIASAPSANHSLNGRIPSTGQYVLFRIDGREPTTSSPRSVTQVGIYDLQEGQHVGFEWVPDDKTQNTPDAHMDLIAFAGSVRQNLGPITGLQQSYCWATKDGFQHYWTVEPALGFYNRMTLQN